jgi:hypothetical protein
MPALTVPQLQQLGLPAQLDKYLRDVNTAVNSALVKGDSYLVTTTHTATAPLVVPTDWQTPTLNAGWTNFGGGFESAGYRKDAFGAVWVRGLLKSAAAGIAFTLPAGYRPSALRMSSTILNAGAGEVVARLDVDASGNVALPNAAPSSYGSVACSFPCADGSPYVPSCFPINVLWTAPAAPSVVLVPGAGR